MLRREDELEPAGALFDEPARASLSRCVRNDCRGFSFDRGVRRISRIKQIKEFDEFAAAVAVLDQGMDLAGEQLGFGWNRRTSRRRPVKRLR
jgi:hypothetical protein